MAETKKFLDQEGVKHLWSKINMQDYPNNETLINVINAIDETKADKSELVQSDWNQNDETALDYIKNRTHYRELAELVNETPTYNSEEGLFYFSTHCELVPGDTYIVNYCGTEYTCVADMIDGLAFIGNGLELGFENTGEPFFIVCDGLAALMSIDYNGATEITVAISGYKYTQIPQAYLPNINKNIVNGSAIGSIRTIGSSGEDPDYTMGEFAFAEGADTKADGEASHAEGAATKASGYVSHAEGDSTTASGGYSHAEGRGTKASAYYSHVQGQYNIADTTSAHIVGNGTADDARSNAHTLDWDGNAWFAGDVYIGSTSGTNKDEGSVKLAKLSEIPTKTSDLSNDSGFLTSYTETDPTVPAWAKASTKPTYTASEVGADVAGTADTLVSTHANNKSNPHEVTAAQLGLKTESWTFTLEDGSTVTKVVYVG